MNLANITADSLSKAMDREIPEMYVVLAKHSVMGMDHESVAEVLGVETKELVELESDPLYKEVRTQVGALHAEGQATRVFGWDGLEAEAIKKLADRIPFEKDSDFLLKVAAVANKAQRRGVDPMGVLDPSKAGRTAVTLTQRMVQRITNMQEERIVERELSIHDGSMQRVSFAEVDELLSVTNRPAIPRSADISTRNADPSMRELDEEMEHRI